MDLSLLDKIITLFKLPFSSFLMIEIFLIFIILYIFFLYNEKRKNKKVKIALTTLIIFFFFLLVFYFSDDIKIVITEIMKVVFKCFYFPNIIFYIFTVFISLLILITNIFKTKRTRKDMIITYTLTFIHLFLFTEFISLSITNDISLINEAAIYEQDNMFVIVLASQIIFIILILYKLISHFYTKKPSKLKNNK